jgi:Fe-S-cluster containining protein
VQLQRRAQAVFRLYHRLDLHTRSFRRSSGLECLRGCGQCCLSPNVEATVLEMLLAAFRLRHEGRLEQSLALLETQPAPEVCLLYRPQPQRPARGHCGLYEHRPLLCRLFGFAAALDREGKRELATCSLIRTAQPEAAARAAEAVRGATVIVPVMPNYHMELYGIDPSLGARPLPINLALARALQMVGLDGRRWSRRHGLRRWSRVS